MEEFNRLQQELHNLISERKDLDTKIEDTRNAILAIWPIKKGDKILWRGKKGFIKDIQYIQVRNVGRIQYRLVKCKKDNTPSKNYLSSFWVDAQYVTKVDKFD